MALCHVRIHTQEGDSVLTPKQQRFVDEYLVDLNASAAARRAGYSVRTADAIGRENLGKPTIAAAIAAAKAQRSERTRIDADWVLRTLAEEKAADLADLFDEAGNVLPVREWPVVFRRGVVVGIESFEEYAGRGEDRAATGTVRKIKLVDRVKHLELIGRHVDVQAFRDQKALTGPGGEPLTLATVDLSKATPEQLRALASLKLSDAGD
jgi:phage terminase small subunit